jgi:phage terminase large subunit-like protein
MTTAQQQRARRAPVRKPAARSSATGKLQFELNPRQYDFVFSPARFSFYVGGRGAGKSYAGALRSIIQSQEQPGSLGLVGAPTYPMLRDAAQRMFFELCPPALLARHNKTENVTVFRNGSEILWRPAFEYDRYRGLNLAWFWLDEAPWCGYEAWQILKATLRQSGYQTAAWATGTPRGRDGYARDFELAPQDGHALYRASTWANAHNLPASFVADLGYSGAFAEQEIEGLFVAFDGLVYMLDATENGNLRAGDGDYGRVIGGIDWGYTNPTALLVFGLDGDKRAWQLDEFYQRRASMEEIIRTALVKLTKQYNVSVWYADAADPEAIDGANNALARAGLQCRVRAVQKGAGSVRAGIQTVTSLLALRGDGTRGLYIDPKCVNTIAEFGSYAYATTERAKRDPAEEPIKQSDHAMDATRYALWSAFGQQTAVDAYLHEMSRLVRPKPAQPEGYFR